MNRFALLLAALASFTASCEQPALPRPPSNPATSKSVAGFGVFRGCTPNTEELCHNAIDDNCNGLVDESCGEEFSVIAFQVAWSDASTDVDLEVIGPSGEMVRRAAPNTEGLLKAQDCPQDEGCVYGYERVFLRSKSPREGSYRITVRLESLGRAIPPIEVRVAAQLGRRTFEEKASLTIPGERFTRSYSYEPGAPSRDRRAPGVKSSKP